MFPTSTAMNKFLAPILVIGALQLVAISPVAGNEGDYPLIKTTACPGAAYTYGRLGFTYVRDEFTPFVPQRTYVAKTNVFPYVYRLREEFIIGQAITVRGIIPENTESLSISLLSKTPVYDLEVGETVFHISIRMANETVGFTSIKDGKWEPERTKSISLRYDEEFEVVIRALHDCFEVIINGIVSSPFTYSKPLHIIDTVSIQGNAKVTELRIGGHDHMSFKNASKIDLPGGHWKRNERIIIDGYTKVDAFEINLLDAKGLRAFQIIAHLDDGYVARNSETSSNVWGGEEFAGGMPFSKAQDFAIDLTNKACGIEMYVNRKYFTTFDHRIDNPEVGYKAVSFSSTVTIEGLEICTKSL
uniref:Galectin n=1 Tax=Panagrellus redivivus TaxID=6233 RepID=A0A7E4W665_PANRE